MTKRLDIIAPENFSLVEPGDNLPALILNSLKQEGIALQPGDVLVLAQKIVSKSARAALPAFCRHTWWF